MMGVGIDDWEMGTRALLCGIELTWGLSVVRDSSRRYKRDGERGKEKQGEIGEGSRNEERERTLTDLADSQSSELKDLLQCQQYRILDMGYVQLIRTAGMDRVKLKQ